MTIETWRWRFVMFLLGLGLLGTGLYCLLHPGEVPLNICYSRTSKMLRSLNTVFTIGAFLAITGVGGAIVYLVGYSIKEGWTVKEDRQPVDVRHIVLVVLGNLLILLALAGAVVLAQWFLKGVSGP